jgi:hypothetical protein
MTHSMYRSLAGQHSRKYFMYIKQDTVDKK